MIALKDFEIKDSYRLWQDDEGSTIIHYYAPKNKKGEGAVVVFAGGGYNHRAAHEGEGYAKFLSENGISAFVVDYRVFPNLFPCPLLDARRAIRFVRYYSEKFGINPEKICAMGSSAGGHLTALLSTSRYEIEGEGVDEIDELSAVPNGQILAYPVITTVDESIMHKGSLINLVGEDNLHLAEKVSPELLADASTPPAFIWHCCGDTGVVVANSYTYANALSKFRIPVEMHIFPHGPHGLGLARGSERIPEKMADHIGRWGDFLLEWLEYMDLT